MIRTLKAAMVVARRDFSAVIFSKSFILFLIGPMLPVIFGLAAGGVGSKMFSAEPEAPVVSLTLPKAEGGALTAARERLAKDLGESALPKLTWETGQSTAVLSGSLSAPTLTGRAGDLNGLDGDMRLMIAMARGDTALPQTRLTLKPIAEQATDRSERGRLILGQGAQLMLFFLTMMLAGMVLSNLVEEKTNKIMEILAAAIPIDAVFIGKLLAMLSMSLVGIACWGGLAAIFLGGDAGLLARLPDPAVGWPAFALLSLLYFGTAYTLLGAMFIGIGAQAATVRQVQTLSMPVTMGQVIIFFLAANSVDHMGSTAERAAAIFSLEQPVRDDRASGAVTGPQPTSGRHRLAIAVDFHYRARRRVAVPAQCTEIGRRPVQAAFGRG